MFPSCTKKTLLSSRKNEAYWMCTLFNYCYFHQVVKKKKKNHLNLKSKLCVVLKKKSFSQHFMALMKKYIGRNIFMLAAVKIPNHHIHVSPPAFRPPSKFPSTSLPSTLPLSVCSCREPQLTIHVHHVR